MKLFRHVKMAARCDLYRCQRQRYIDAEKIKETLNDALVKYRKDPPYDHGVLTYFDVVRSPLGQSQCIVRDGYGEYTSFTEMENLYIDECLDNATLILYGWYVGSNRSISTYEPVIFFGNTVESILDAKNITTAYHRKKFRYAGLLYLMQDTTVEKNYLEEVDEYLARKVFRDKPCLEACDDALTEVYRRGNCPVFPVYHANKLLSDDILETYSQNT